MRASISAALICVTLGAVSGRVIGAKPAPSLSLGNIAPLSAADRAYYKTQSALRDDGSDIEDFGCDFVANGKAVFTYEAGAMGVSARVNGRLVYFKPPGAPAKLPKHFTSFDKSTQVDIVETKPAAASGTTRMASLTVERGASKIAYPGQ